MIGHHWAFSGIDGAGKTTQIELLLCELEANGRRARRVWIRVGYTPLFDWSKMFVRCINSRVLPPSGRSVKRERRFRSPLLRRVWLTVAMLDLLLYLGLWVRFLRWAGYDVVADRWIEDSELDLLLNFPKEQANQWVLWRILKWVAPRPSIHFVFLIPIDESLRRSQEKGEPFPDNEVVLRERLSNYEQLVGLGQVTRMDGLASREILQAKVRAFCKVF